MLARYLHQAENEESIAALARIMSREEFQLNRTSGTSQGQINNAIISESAAPHLRNLILIGRVAITKATDGLSRPTVGLPVEMFQSYIHLDARDEPVFAFVSTRAAEDISSSKTI